MGQRPVDCLFKRQFHGSMGAINQMCDSFDRVRPLAMLTFSLFFVSFFLTRCSNSRAVRRFVEVEGNLPNSVL